MSLLEHKVLLVEQGQGSTVLLEAEAGMGKTHLLATFIATALPDSAAVYYVSGKFTCRYDDETCE
jgi:chromosomal replication initiation ATPase DnaA